MKNFFAVESDIATLFCTSLLIINFSVSTCHAKLLSLKLVAILWACGAKFKWCWSEMSFIHIGVSGCVSVSGVVQMHVQHLHECWWTYSVHNHWLSKGNITQTYSAFNHWSTCNDHVYSYTKSMLQYHAGVTVIRKRTTDSYHGQVIPIHCTFYRAWMLSTARIIRGPKTVGNILFFLQPLTLSSHCFLQC